MAVPAVTMMAAWMLECGLAPATLALPPRLTREQAGARVAARMAGLLGRLPAPGSLILIGGETSRGGLALGAVSLEVRDFFEPEMPVRCRVGPLG